MKDEDSVCSTALPTPLFNPSTNSDIGFYETLLSLCMRSSFYNQLSFHAFMPSSSTLPTSSTALSPPAVHNNDITRMEDTTPVDDGICNKTEQIVPNNDKEGWCRNKKYISKIQGGFMCTVCRKVYGRYNSVSYHVTIYHRNPPIACGMPGCEFTTREARYIHFHKYYRHGVELPLSIDLGCRRCPFCRHVSKSPAMLEKHIARHETGKERDRDKQLRSKGKEGHDVAGEINKDSPLLNPSLSCRKCSYRARDPEMLSQHDKFTHSTDVFIRHKCPLCTYSAPSETALLQHSVASHLLASLSPQATST